MEGDITGAKLTNLEFLYIVVNLLSSMDLKGFFLLLAMVIDQIIMPSSFIFQ